MYTPLPLVRLGQLQRVLLVALAMIPMLLVTTALLPALTLLPFLPGGLPKASILVAQLRTWTGQLLRGSGGSVAVAVTPGVHRLRAPTPRV